MASEKFHKTIDYIILFMIPLVIGLTILIGVRPTLDIFGLSIETPDYLNYYQNYWSKLLNLENPYPATQYPIGFLAFGGLYAIYYLLPKIFFCLSWIYTGYFIHGLCKKYEVSRKSTLYYVFALILLNPVYLGSILASGHYDPVVGLCILLAVFSLQQSKQIRSGLYAACALLLKFLGLILIFPLVFLKKKINWKIGVIFLTLAGGVYLFGYYLWGTPVFQPFFDQIFRVPESGPIFILSQWLGISTGTLLTLAFIGGILIVIIFLYYQNTDFITFSLILILLFILVLPSVWVHYATWFLPLSVYWCLTHNGKLQGTVAYYHFGGLVAALVSWPGQQTGDPLLITIGGVIFLIVTIIYVLLLFKHRIREGEKV
ncbi:MAG: hypothetical protein ACTSRS_06920 [Candidatus Helarchaeota archaeon]